MKIVVLEAMMHNTTIATTLQKPTELQHIPKLLQLDQFVSMKLKPLIRLHSEKGRTRECETKIAY